MNKKTLIILISLFLCPQLVFAKFDPAYIISDYELFDYNTMTKSDIARFLSNKNSFLAKSNFFDYTDELSKPAADIIYLASQKYQVNPRVLLVLLQKEQSLVEKSNPSQYNLDWATGFGVCDSCRVDSPDLEIYKGFSRQVYLAAKQLRDYQNNHGNYYFKIGNMYNIDNSDVLLLNKATANLYNYTPHIAGNYNFWKIYQGWFSFHYLNGSLLQAIEDNSLWYIQYGLKRKISNWSVFLSRFNPAKIIRVSLKDLENYDLGPVINFPQYSLLKTSDNKIYLLVDDKLRMFESPEVFRKMGFLEDELIKVASADLASYSLGEPLTNKSIYPTGALLQLVKSGGVYYVRDGVKYPIYSREILQANFARMPIIKTDEKELTAYTLGEPVKFKDGELLKAKNDKAVYVIEDGYRRFIPSEAVFEKLGYNWNNIIEVTDKVIALHPMGEDLDIGEENNYNQVAGLNGQ